MWYLVRRHLGFDIDQWEALPWPRQMVYLEGIEQEFYDPDQEEENADDSDDLGFFEQAGSKIRVVEAA